MMKVLCVVVLSLGLASCGGSVDAAGQPETATAKEGGCCSGCADEGAAKAAEPCCDEAPAAEKAGACCSEGLAVPPAEAKKPEGKQ